MQVYCQSVLLEAAVEDVFAFHANPANITAISPGWQKAEVLRGGVPAVVGIEFEIRVLFFGLIPVRWLGQWREVESPALLFDDASSRLLPRWEHRHQFRSVGPQRTEMTDAVSYELPLGVLGRWFGAPLMAFVLTGMFEDRHRRTRAYFEDRAPGSNA